MKVKAIFKLCTICSCLLGIASVFAADFSSKEVKVFYYNLTDPFIVNLDKNLKEHAKIYGYTIKVYDAADDAFLQSEQLDIALADKDQKVFLVNLVDPSYAKQFLTELPEGFNSKIIFFNRKVDADTFALYDKALYVGSNARASGRYQADLLVSYLKNNPNFDKNNNGILDLVLLKGEATHLDTILRTTEFCKALNESGVKYKISYSFNADWSFQKAFDGMDRAISKLTFNNVEAIVCNNDSMALGAITNIEQYGYNQGDPNRYIPVVGIDAIPDAIKAIKDGRLLGTVCQDTAKMSEIIFKVISSDSFNIEDISKEAELKEENKVIYVPYHQIRNIN